MFNVLVHGLLVSPVFGRVSNAPVRRKLKVGVTAVSLALIDDLDRKEAPN